MQQLSFFQDSNLHKDVAHRQFSHNHLCREEGRLALEDKYIALFEETDRFNRQLVSFQANKTEVLHSWLLKRPSRPRPNKI